MLKIKQLKGIKKYRDINEKMTPWMNPIFDILKEDFTANQIKYLQKESEMIIILTIVEQ